MHALTVASTQSRIVVSWRGAGGRGGVDRGDDGVDALAGEAVGGQDWAAGSVGEGLGVDGDAASFGLIDAVEDEDGGQPDAEDLGDEAEVAREVCGVEHDRGGVGGA